MGHFGVKKAQDVLSTDLIGAVTDVVTRGFDVTVEVPLHVRLLRIVDGDPRGEYVLVLVLHHISGDALSLTPLARDVMRERCDVHPCITSRASNRELQTLPRARPFSDLAFLRKRPHSHIRVPIRNLCAFVPCTLHARTSPGPASLA